MRKAEVEVGKVYAAKVSDRIVPVRLDSINPAGGWNATNLRTDRQVRIRSAAKLRFQVVLSTRSAEHPKGKWVRKVATTSE